MLATLTSWLGVVSMKTVLAVDRRILLLAVVAVVLVAVALALSALGGGQPHDLGASMVEYAVL